jgi:hypothetical protein
MSDGMIQQYWPVLVKVVAQRQVLLLGQNSSPGAGLRMDAQRICNYCGAQQFVQKAMLAVLGTARHTI